MIYLITFEPDNSRYTTQWNSWVVNALNKLTNDVVEIKGDIESGGCDAKNFYDPIDTNIWKSQQVIKIGELFKQGKVSNGDTFVFYDAWNPAIINVYYMAKLSHIDIKMYGFWHDGSYDFFDLTSQCGMRVGAKFFESSVFNILDKSFFATEYHKDLALRGSPFSMEFQNKMLVTGFPYDFSHLDIYKNTKKENLIVFPHRLSSEKQVEILKDLEPDLNKRGIEVIFCREHKLSKDEYHKILAKSKIVFSSSLQETWGIGVFEGMYLGAVPVVPASLSYNEMYPNYTYPSEWIANYENYISYKDRLLANITNIIEAYNIEYEKSIEMDFEVMRKRFCSFDYNNIIF